MKVEANYTSGELTIKAIINAGSSSVYYKYIRCWRIYDEVYIDYPGERITQRRLPELCEEQMDNFIEKIHKAKYDL